MSKKIKSFSIFIFKIVVSSVLIYFLFSKVDIKSIGIYLDKIHYTPIMIALGIGAFDRLLQSYKWTFLINSYGFKVKYIDAISTDMMGNFAGQFLPAGIGGDVVRVFLLKKVGLPMLKTAASIFVERLLGVFSLIFCALMASLICLILDFKIPSSVINIIAILFVIFLISISVSFSRIFSSYSLEVMEKMKKTCGYKYRAFLEKGCAALESYLHFSMKKSILLNYFLLSIIEVFAVCLVFYSVSEAVPLGVNFLQMVLIVPLIQLIQRIPISISGIGVQEGLLVYFLSSFNVNFQLAIVFSILIRIVGILILLPGGLLFLKKRPASVNKYTTINVG